jgi:hypothetical protein
LEGGELPQSEKWPIECGDNIDDDDDAVLVYGAVAMHSGGHHERHMHVPTVGKYATLRDTRGGGQVGPFKHHPRHASSSMIRLIRYPLFIE